jgi:hypothetical protein
MMKKLKEKWQITSDYQLVIIFIVFAITGSTSAYLSNFLIDFIGWTKTDLGLLYFPIKLILIFPIYQVLLLFFGFLFGQFSFFYKVIQRILSRMGLSFLFKNQL